MSRARVVITGAGADEQLCGYGRHKVEWNKGGEVAVTTALRDEMTRIAIRNLGRDDRCISDHGREPRFPYLDEEVVRFLAGLPLCQIADLSQERGVGDKMVLRRAAAMLGLSGVSRLAKRAIQFGSNIAKLSNKESMGSNRRGKGDRVYTVETPTTTATTTCVKNDGS